MKKVIFSQTDARLQEPSFPTDCILEIYRRNNLPVYVYIMVQDQYRNQQQIWYKADLETFNSELPPLQGKVSKYGPITRKCLSDIDAGDLISDSNRIGLTKFNENDLLERSNPILVQMLEEGLLPDDFTIAFIPDNCAFYIDTEDYVYDSKREIIREVHKIWK